MDSSMKPILVFCLGGMVFLNNMSAMQQPFHLEADEVVFQLYCHEIEDGLPDATAEKTTVEKYVNMCERSMPIVTDSAVKFALWKSELAKIDHVVISPQRSASIVLPMTRMLRGVREKIRHICDELQVVDDPGFIRRWGGRLSNAGHVAYSAGRTALSVVNPVAYWPLCSGQKPKEKTE